MVPGIAAITAPVAGAVVEGAGPAAWATPGTRPTSKSEVVLAATTRAARRIEVFSPGDVGQV
jgi:hypothetical protein